MVMVQSNQVVSYLKRIICGDGVQKITSSLIIITFICFCLKINWTFVLKLACPLLHVAILWQQTIVCNFQFSTWCVSFVEIKDCDKFVFDANGTTEEKKNRKLNLYL